MKILRAVIAVFAAVALIIWVIVMFVESEEKDLGPVPVYEMQTELDALIDKGKTSGLTQEESLRLRWLTDDRKKQIDIFYEQNIKK